MASPLHLAAGAAPTCMVSGSAGDLFTQLLATLVHAQCLLADRSTFPPDTGNPLPEYDFVVVGAGSAGAALATRLSENPSWSVALLEAGGDPPPTSHVPKLFQTLQKTEVDWAYRTEPDGRACLAHVEGRCSWPRGKALGGTSTINGMMHIRGSPQDFDSWAKLGNDGWSYEEVLPFFKKLETFEEKELQARPETVAVHGRDGPISVSRGPRGGPVQDALDAAAIELGYNLVDDYSAQPVHGFGPVHTANKGGTRSSSATGYLGSAKNRQNLHVIKFAYVTKVLIDKSTKVAYGVQYLKDGEKREIKASKEVIMSAGAINSPHILMHSGIGPKEHLEEFGIPVIQDLRVGYNLQDHPMFTGLYYTRVPRKGNSILNAAYEYLVNRTGFLSTPGDSLYTGFIQTDKAPMVVPQVDATNFPDMQFHYFMFESAYPDPLKNFARIMGYTDEVTNTLMQLIKERDALCVVPTLLPPTSRGRVKLSSGDPTDLPLIESGYYVDPRDLDNVLAGVKFAVRMGSTDAMRKAGFSLWAVPLQVCSHHTPMSDDFWRCLVPQLTETLYHPTSSVKMGPPSDEDAVVDERLRVRGIQRLRVADASIMPLIVRANPNAATVMIGEKCAHMVKEDWAHQKHTAAGKSEL